MKRQGKYGFTWDSKAEEWAAWARGCLQQDTPRGGSEFLKLTGMIDDYEAEAERYDRLRRIAIAADPYRAIIWRDEPRKAPLWPFAAIAVVLTVVAAVVWGWG